jgi:DNA processing protein
MDDLKYWVALHRISGLGPVRFGKLEARFGTLAEAWQASRADLIAAGIDQKTAAEVVEQRSHIDPDGELDRLEQAGVRAIHRRSPDYPALLAETYDAPSVIYLKGELAPVDGRAVAVVGTRGPTVYGREMARRLSYDLAATGVTVVSGLARGVDGISHKSALEAGGRTMAVMGGGLDSIYPPEHTSLAARIVQSGAIVSEYPLGMRPQAEHFPRRNRVISGLSLGVVVVEADMDSGAMITVKWALEQDREVFAVPGTVLSPKSNGPNWLIQQGAKLVTNFQDILEELNIAGLQTPRQGEMLERGLPTGMADANGAHADTPDAHSAHPRVALPGGVAAVGGQDSALDSRSRNDEAESGVAKALAGGPMHVDDLTRELGLPAHAVSAALAVLELRGIVRQIGPMQFAADPARPAFSKPKL